MLITVWDCSTEEHPIITDILFPGRVSYLAGNLLFPQETTS